jgi:hypothetical protein
MVVRGRVQNGVIVLDEGVQLPEGEEVTVLSPATSPAGSQIDGQRRHSVLDIETIDLGRIIQPLTSEDDLLGEMLEGRP